MAGAARVSNINLYAVEDKLDDSKKFEIEVVNDDVKFECQQAQKFSASSYQFLEGATYFDLGSRFSSLESSTVGADNAAAIAQLQADLAAEAVSRQSGDVANSNSISAEVSARTTAVQAVQDALDVQEAKQESEKDASDAAIAAEAVSRAAGDAAEQARALAAEAALGVRIDNVISNSDPASLDSLSELLTAYQAADTSLGDSITAALARISALEAKVDALTNDDS